MKLLTEEIISKFEAHPFGSQDGKGLNAEVLVKYFNPCGSGTWLITEAEREGDDWRLYGYCHIFEWEWGYLLLSKLASLRLPFGLRVERDLYTGGKNLRGFLFEEESRELAGLGGKERGNGQGRWSWLIAEKG